MIINRQYFSYLFKSLIEAFFICSVSPLLFSAKNNFPKLSHSFKPSAAINISKIILKVGKFTEELNGDSKTSFKKDQWHMLAGYEGVELGQSWSFTFYGREVVPNKYYKITTTYVVNQ